MKIQIVAFLGVIIAGSWSLAQEKLSALPDTTVTEIKRDPFHLPDYLVQKLRKASDAPPAPIINSQNRIDDSVDPIRRWPLSSYALVGIIWDVKSPKALISDQQRKVHLIHVNDKIGSEGGVVTTVREGSIVILQNKTPQVIRLKK